jgi:hypothetical protein
VWPGCGPPVSSGVGLRGAGGGADGDPNLGNMFLGSEYTH